MKKIIASLFFILISLGIAGNTQAAPTIKYATGYKDGKLHVCGFVSEWNDEYTAKATYSFNDLLSNNKNSFTANATKESLTNGKQTIHASFDEGNITTKSITVSIFIYNSSSTKIAEFISPKIEGDRIDKNFSSCTIATAPAVTISPTSTAATTNTSSTNTGPSIKNTPYKFLAPLPGFGEYFDISQPDAINTFINNLFKLFLGVLSVGAVVYFIYEGIQYMYNEGIAQKKASKERMWEIFWGLLIALGTLTFLNTLNPKIVSTELGIQKIEIEFVVQDFEDALAQELKENKNAVSNTSSYTLEGTFEAPKPSSDQVKTCAESLAAGKKITKMVARAIAPHSKDNKMDIYTGTTLCATVPINIGYAGVTDWPVSERNKTPRGANGPAKGNKTVTTIGQLPKKGAPAICRLGGKEFNCGAAYIETNITNEKGSPRFIGIHGQGDNRIGTSAGCLKMKNDDLVLLAKYMGGVELSIIK